MEQRGRTARHHVLRLVDPSIRGPGAIRASIALPSFISPVALNGRLLADGGLLNPIPVAATVAAGADVTLAVSLSEGGPSTAGAAPVQESAEPRPREEWLDRSRRTVAELLDVDLVRTVSSWFTGGSAPSTADAQQHAESQAQEEVYGELPPGLRTVDVMRLSPDALQSVVTRYRLAGYPPDLMVTIPREACRTLDFHRAGEMIELGRTRAVEALDGETPFAAGDHPAPRVS